MDYPVTHPAFTQHRLVVRAGSLWSGTRVLYDGAPLARTRVVLHDGEMRRFGYTATDDAGNEAVLRLKISIGDPVPILLINDETVHLAPPLSMGERVWICLPLLLLFIGGALGGVVGATGAYVNSYIFRSPRGTFAKYALTALVSVGAIVAFLVVVTLLRAAFGWQ